jgi:hypothetical protein
LKVAIRHYSVENKLRQTVAKWHRFALIVIKNC